MRGTPLPLSDRKFSVAAPAILHDAVKVAATKQLKTISEYTKDALRDALERDGVRFDAA